MPYIAENGFKGGVKHRPEAKWGLRTAYSASLTWGFADAQYRAAESGWNMKSAGDIPPALGGVCNATTQTRRLAHYISLIESRFSSRFLRVGCAVDDGSLVVRVEEVAACAERDKRGRGGIVGKLHRRRVEAFGIP